MFTGVFDAEPVSADGQHRPDEDGKDGKDGDEVSLENAGVEPGRAPE
jgi:hypothetical protein